MRLDYSENRILVAPENDREEAYMQRIFQGSPPRVTMRRGALILEGSAGVTRRECTPGDLPLRNRLQDRASAR